MKRIVWIGGGVIILIVILYFLFKGSGKNNPGITITKVEKGKIVDKALACDPSIILADEPTGNLDSVAGKEIIDIFVDLWKQGHTIAVITHDKEISSRTQRIIKLRDGKVVDGSQSVYLD
jgi:ABC-type ATPase involved in cell division